MNPCGLLDVADSLIAGLTEAEWRSAMSRAYYAAFDVARQFMHQGGSTVAWANQVHGYLWLRLANSGHPDVNNAGNDLNDLRQMRNWADYALDMPFNQITAIDNVQLAGTIVQLLDMVSADPTVRTQVIQAMAVYERDVLREVTWHP